MRSARAELLAAVILACATQPVPLAVAESDHPASLPPADVRRDSFFDKRLAHGLQRVTGGAWRAETSITFLCVITPPLGAAAAAA